MIENQLRDDIIVINSDEKNSIEYKDSLNLHDNRTRNYMLERDSGDPLVSIVVIAYNNLERLTKPAIESLLRYTKDIDYELILIDNGSSDGTLEYFKMISYQNKKIYRITKNIGGLYGWLAPQNHSIGRFIRGKYLVNFPNDIRVTRNWLHNMLKCMESDESIGLVVPLSDNVSNHQQVDLQYKDFQDMQKKAILFNRSNPKKWEERIRAIPFIGLHRVDAFKLMGLNGDSAFIYNFSDDDISFQYRRLGYKVMVCGDVFVHHKGSTVVRNNEQQYIQDMEKGRMIFKKKYHGIDAWNDTCNFEKSLIYMLNPCGRKDGIAANILGVDVRCGTPLLEIKNKMKSTSKSEPILYGYIQDAKYWLDMQTVCSGNVVCDRLIHFDEHFHNRKFDYIILGESIYSYSFPFVILDHLMASLEVGGKLAFKLDNRNDINHFFTMAQGGRIDQDADTDYFDLCQHIQEKNYSIVKSSIVSYTLGVDEKKQLGKIVEDVIPDTNAEGYIKKLLIKSFEFILERNI